MRPVPLLILLLLGAVRMALAGQWTAQRFQASPALTKAAAALAVPGSKSPTLAAIAQLPEAKRAAALAPFVHAMTGKLTPADIAALRDGHGDWTKLEEIEALARSRAADAAGYLSARANSPELSAQDLADLQPDYADAVAVLGPYLAEEKFIALKEAQGKVRARLLEMGGARVIKLVREGSGGTSRDAVVRQLEGRSEDGAVQFIRRHAPAALPAGKESVAAVRTIADQATHQLSHRVHAAAVGAIQAAVRKPGADAAATRQAAVEALGEIGSFTMAEKAQSDVLVALSGPVDGAEPQRIAAIRRVGEHAVSPAVRRAAAEQLDNLARFSPLSAKTAADAAQAVRLSGPLLTLKGAAPTPTGRGRELLAAALLPPAVIATTGAVTPAFVAALPLGAVLPMALFAAVMLGAMIFAATRAENVLARSGRLAAYWGGGLAVAAAVIGLSFGFEADRLARLLGMGGVLAAFSGSLMWVLGRITLQTRP